MSELLNEIELDELELNEEVEVEDLEELETEELSGDLEELEEVEVDELEEIEVEEVEEEELEEVEETPAPKAKKAAKAKTGAKAVIPTKKAAAKKKAVKKVVKKETGGKPVIVRKSASQSVFGRTAKKEIREIPQHEIMPRDVMMDHWMAYLAEYSFRPTGVKNDIIEQGQLLDAFAGKKTVATGAFLAVEGFMQSIIQNHQANFMGMLFRHRANVGRVNPAPNENTPRTYSPAHLAVVARKPLVELHGEKLRTIPGTVDAEGNFEVNDEADAQYLGEMQERVDTFSTQRAKKAPKKTK